MSNSRNLADLLDANGDVSLVDNVKATFGASDDLQIYHDGAASVITDVGVGHLIIGGENLYLKNAALTETYVDCVTNAGVYLRYDNSVKLNTTSTGIDVTGTVTADGLTVDGDVTLGSDSVASNINIVGDVAVINVDSNSNGGAAANISLKSKGVNIAKFSNGGDISFYEDTGTTPKFFWDASAERLGVGTTSPSRPLDVTDSTGDGTGGIVINSYLPTFELDDISAGGTSFILQQDGTNTIFKHDATERMRIDSSGNLLVGTTDTNPANDASGTGLAVGSAGWVAVARDGDTSGMFNRLTSDGDIVSFHKDGTTVGSIGTSGGHLTIESNGSLLLTDGTITPFDYNDGTEDLGRSNARFKDLYLSGTVNATTVDLGNWTITESAGVLYFATSGTNKMKLDASGNLTVTGNVTAYGTV